jgi:hypothetical protein
VSFFLIACEKHILFFKGMDNVIIIFREFILDRYGSEAQNY